MWVLAAVYGLSHVELATCLQMLLSHKSLTIQDADIVTAALDLFRAKPSLGFSDCLMLQLTKGGSSATCMFDRGLAKVEGGTQRL